MRHLAPSAPAWEALPDLEASWAPAREGSIARRPGQGKEKPPEAKWHGAAISPILKPEDASTWTSETSKPGLTEKQAGGVMSLAIPY